MPRPGGRKERGASRNREWPEWLEPRVKDMAVKVHAGEVGGSRTQGSYKLAMLVILSFI